MTWTNFLTFLLLQIIIIVETLLINCRKYEITMKEYYTEFKINATILSLIWAISSLPINWEIYLG